MAEEYDDYDVDWIDLDRGHDDGEKLSDALARIRDLESNAQQNDEFYDQLHGSILGMLSEAGYSFERTGNMFSINGTEYMVTRPDGGKQRVWSPVWGDFHGTAKDMMAMLAVALDLVKSHE